MMPNEQKKTYSDFYRIFWLKIIVVGALLCGLLLSLKLWMGGRLFPHVPVLERFFVLPPQTETILFALFVGGLAIVLFAQKPKKFIFIALSIGAILVFFDQMRLQPWFYQYFFMLATLAMFSFNDQDSEKQKAVLNTLRLIIASVYFFSGLQKINPAFFTAVFPWIVGPVIKLLPVSLQSLPLTLGIFVPFIEMGIGVGLLVKPLRKYAIILAVAMLVFVLYALGPLGHNYNSVVWPWNVAMVLFVILLFWKADDGHVNDVVWVHHFPFHKIILVLFVVMPFFSLFNLWDSYPSFALYSGNTNSAQIYITDTVKNALPKELQQYATKNTAGTNMFDFFHWSFDELNVPPYPETRTFKAIGRDLCKYIDNNTDMSLVINGKPTMFNKGEKLRYDCLDL